MARVPGILHFMCFILCIGIVLCGINNPVREFDEDNWTELLDGEWMVEFYAPWCPACNALRPVWIDLSRRTAKTGYPAKAGAVDVTKSPGLSGRFIVTALPTIFHVKGGIFRHYKGPRDVDSMMDFLQNEKWKQTDAIPSWKAPDSIQMTILSYFFKFSQYLRSIHTTLLDTYGLPTWGSYLIFAVVTIFIGAALGLVLVCVIDFLYPPKTSLGKVLIQQSELDMLAKGDQDGRDSSDADNILINEDLVDDAHDSDAERNSPSDSSDEEDQKADAAGDTKEEQSDKEDGKGAGTEVRKRRPRKAD